jgi:hypothetical protein
MTHFNSLGSRLIQFGLAQRPGDTVSRLFYISMDSLTFTESGCFAETCHKYLSAGVELNKSAFAAIHFKASLPGRGTEVTSIRYLNSKLYTVQTHEIR